MLLLLGEYSNTTQKGELLKKTVGEGEERRESKVKGLLIFFEVKGELLLGRSNWEFVLLYHVQAFIQKWMKEKFQPFGPLYFTFYFTSKLPNRPLRLSPGLYPTCYSLDGWRSLLICSPTFLKMSWTLSIPSDTYKFFAIFIKFINSSFIICIGTFWT